MLFKYIQCLNPFGVREVSKRIWVVCEEKGKVLIPLESGKFLNLASQRAASDAISLNPFGVREVSKPIVTEAIIQYTGS